MSLQIDRTLPLRRGEIRSAGKPRSKIYELHDLRAYAVTLDYFPSEDRLRIGYSIGQPVIPRPWLVVEEDPLEGLWVDPRVPVGYLLADIPVARQFLAPRHDSAFTAVDRLLDMLKDLDSLI